MGMSFFDYAWSALLQVSRKKREETKLLLRDNLTFPVLGYDAGGFVVCLVKPRKINASLMRYEDMVLDYSNLSHRKMLWQLFKASIFHLGAHTTVSDFKIYDDWAGDKDKNLATFSASLVEDAIATAYFKSRWPNLLRDIAYANAVSYLRTRAWSKTANEALLLMTSALLQYHVGMTRSRMNEKSSEDVRIILSSAKEIENLAYQRFQENGIQEDGNLAASLRVHPDERLSAATKIFNVLEKHGETAEVPYLLYTESYGKGNIFENALPIEDGITTVLETAFKVLGVDAEGKTDTDKRERMLESEIYQIFSAWEARENKQKKILDTYLPLLKDTNLCSIEFPSEDYVEYLRTRATLGGQIRRIMEKLRLLKNITGEDFKHESGLVDLQEAIQVVASRSRRTDIFVREELQSSEQVWSVLVDASHSLNLALGTVRGVALCMGDVARNIILDQRSWAVFAFNTKFYVIKDFTENYTVLSQARIGGLRHSGLTYLPDGIKVVANMLRGRNEQSKVLIVVSDFFPSGYKDIEEKLVENVRKAERSGVGIIGIGVRSRAVKNYFRFNCVIDTPYDLMKKFTKIFIQYSSTR